MPFYHTELLLYKIRFERKCYALILGENHWFYIRLMINQTEFIGGFIDMDLHRWTYPVHSMMLFI